MNTKKGGRPAIPPELKAKMVSMKIPPDLLAAIRQRAKEEGLNMTQIVIKAVRYYLSLKSQPGTHVPPTIAERCLPSVRPFQT